MGGWIIRVGGTYMLSKQMDGLVQSETYILHTGEWTVWTKGGCTFWSGRYVIDDTNDANINIRSTVPPVRMNNLENRGVLQLRNHSGKMYWRQQLLNSIINLQFWSCERPVRKLGREEDEQVQLVHQAQEETARIKRKNWRRNTWSPPKPCSDWLCPNHRPGHCTVRKCFKTGVSQLPLLP